MSHQRFTYRDVPGPRRDMVGYGRRIPRVRWPNGARVAINLVINYEEGSEFSYPAGDGRNDGLTEVIYTMDRPIATWRRSRCSMRFAGRDLAAGASGHGIQAASDVLCLRGGAGTESRGRRMDS